MSNKLNEIFEKYFEEVLEIRIVCNFSSVIELIKENDEFDIFKDSKSTQWENTLNLFNKCSCGRFIFHKPKIEFHIEAEDWYFLDIKTTDFFIRIQDEQTFYYYKNNDTKEYEKEINKENVEEMFKYLSKN